MKSTRMQAVAKFGIAPVVRHVKRDALSLALALVLVAGATARAEADESVTAKASAVDSAATIELPVAASPATASTHIVPGVAGASGSRPRIGLVLGGGGAKGAAHVGVLRVLEEMHIPIDCIAGTSMGALVGGTYAAGMNAVDLEQAMRTISWRNAIAFEGQRTKDPMRRKLSGVTYSNTVGFGLRVGV